MKNVFCLGMTTKSNTFRTSDIKISKDSQDYYTATHPHHGTLIDSSYFPSRTEARREAVVNLMDIKENGSGEDLDYGDDGW